MNNRKRGSSLFLGEGKECWLYWAGEFDRSGGGEKGRVSLTSS
jgi:hypothetical protein